MHNLAPCHLPNIDPTVRPYLAEIPDNYPCAACNFVDKGGDIMVLCDGCNAGYHLSCLDPPLSEVPDVPNWYCHKCDDHMQRTGEAPPVNPRPQREAEEAAGLDGRWVKVDYYHGRSRRLHPHKGQLRFLGAEARPDYFEVLYDDGGTESMGLSKALQHLLPPEAVDVVGAAPSAKPKGRKVTINATHTSSMSVLPAWWDLSTAEGVALALRDCMPGLHLDQLYVADIHASIQSLACHEPLDLPVAQLMRCMRLRLVHGISSVWPLSAATYETLAAHRIPISRVMPYAVSAHDGAVEDGGPLSSKLYLNLLARGQLGALIIAPPVGVLDLALPLAARYAGVVCAYVPAWYLTTMPSARRQWLRALQLTGRLEYWVDYSALYHSSPAAWLFIFSSAAYKERCLRPEYCRN